MKNLYSNLCFIAAMLFISVATITSSYAQGSEPVEHHIGDIITFKDGSQGIVCYVNPDNPSRGWAAALTDLGRYSMQNAEFSKSRLKNTFIDYPDNETVFDRTSYRNININNVGKVNTGILRSYGVPAAMAVDFFNGWYLPDIFQLRIISGYMMSIPYFLPYKGNFGIEKYWSSTKIDDKTQYFMALHESVSWRSHYIYEGLNIRPVRDFGNEVEAVFVDNEMKPTMTVSPTATESYDALVIYGKDTFNIPVTAVVHPVPSLEIAEPSAALCVGSDLKLSATYHTESSSPYTYTWGGDVPVLNPSESSLETESTTSTRLNAPGTYKFYASAADKNGNCRASDTVEVTAKPFALSPIAIGDEICPYDEAVVVGQNTAATTTQYYRWYDSNKELVKADTVAAGAQTQYTTPPVTAETTYYLAVYDESTCAWDPKFMDLCDTIDYSSFTATDTFLLNASKNRGVSELAYDDYIAFYDEGGKDGSISTYNIPAGWTHTFKAPDGFQVRLKINSFKTGGSSYGRLYVYDGTDESGTLLADLSGTSSSRTVISTTGTLTVKWTYTGTTYYSYEGFEGGISVFENVCFAAEAPVTFKNSPYVSLITSVTDDEVCYDGTAELTATSDLDYPQYFTWWNGDYSEILKQDTLLSAGHSSISLPHQTTDTVYHVTVSNADNCSFAPGMSITSMADAHVSITKLADNAIALTDYEFCPHASDEVLTATFSNVSDTYGVIWVIGDDTVATHLNIPNTQLTDTIHYTAPSTAVCGDDIEYHVIYLNDLGCGFASGNKHIRLNDTEAPVVTGTLSEIFVSGCSAADAPAPATSLSELTGITVSDNCSSDFTLSSIDGEPVGLCDKYIRRKYIITDECGNVDSLFQQITIIPPFVQINGVPADKDSVVFSVSEAVAPGAPDAIDNCGNVIVPRHNPAYDSIAHINPDGTGVILHWYHYNHVCGMLRDYCFTYTIVPKKPLVIESNNCELTYNGTEQTCEDYTVTYGGEEIPECTTCGSTPGEHKYVVTPGDTITITDPATRRDVTDSVPNTFTVDIPNPEHYSDIDTVFGKIEIDPLAITIIAASDEKMYDGTPLTKDAWTLDPSTPLATGDAIDTTVVTGSITNPGSIPNVPSNTIVVKGTENVTGNYAINYVNGTLTVTPSDKPLVIESNNCELTYNGTEQTCENYTVTYGGEEIPECTTCGSTPDEHKYVVTPGDTITITDPATRRDVTDSVPNTFTVDIPHPEHYSDIDTVFGKIEIDPLAITIIAASDEKMYDGTPLTKDAWTLDPSTPLAAGDAIDNTTVTGSITNPGSIPNVPSNTIVVKGTEDVTGNYVINYINGTLTVRDLDLEIKDIYEELLCNKSAFAVVPTGSNIPEGTQYKWTVEANPYVTGQSAQTTPVDAPISQALTNTSDELQTVTYHVTPIVDGFECVNFNLYVSVLPTPVLSMSCPNNITRTLEFGSCALLIDPEDLGTPTWAHSLGWTLIHIDNNIEELYPGNMYPEGDNVVTWTMTDECGNTTTCEQHVIVIFPQCPDAIDYEGNIYHGVRIDCDCWTQRNLESNKYSDGTDIPGVFNYYSDIYPDIDDNVDKFGRLYDWESAIKDGADNGYGHVQGICPEGWYLPTVEKYEALNLHGADALKSPLYWLDGGGSNSTGFTSLPAGYYDGSIDRYMNLMGEAYYWSTTQVNGEVGSSSAVLRYICNDVLIQETREGLGYSVRCIKEKDVAPIQTFSCGTSTVKDHEGNEYNTVKIGDQCWTKENMRCTTSPSTGTNILSNGFTYTGKMAYYVNCVSSNTTKYGLLYNWNAAVDTFNTAFGETSTNISLNNAVSVSFSGNRRGICPQGWHVPSEAEWQQLAAYVKSQPEYVGGCPEIDDDIYHILYHCVAKALASATDWPELSYITNEYAIGNNPSTNNATGFSAVPAGLYIYSDGCVSFGSSTNFWSATQYNNGATSYTLYNHRANMLSTEESDMRGGLSVRCIRDVGDNNALGDNESETPTEEPVFICGKFTVKDHEGNVYNTVKLGEQCWTKENMRCTTSPRMGTTILETSPSSYSYTGKKAYYVDGNSSNTSTYGLLYNWNAALDTFNTAFGETSINTEGNNGVNIWFTGNRRGICPQGWHVPNRSDLRQLEVDYFGTQNQFACGSNVRYIAKSLASTTGWNSSTSTCAVGNNPSANNATNFTALPAGERNSAFYGFNQRANFWRLDQSSKDIGSCWYLSYSNAELEYVYDGSSYKSNGYSVRCIRDVGDNSSIGDNESEILTEPAFSCGTSTVKDHEGNEYNTVKIGDQCWTKENMRCTTSPSTGTNILETSPRLTSESGKKAYYPNGNISNVATYGLLYNWNAAVDTFNTSLGETSNNSDNNNAVDVVFSGNRRGICPEGWHVPSDAEWSTLTSYVKSQSNYVCEGNDYSDDEHRTYYIASALSAPAGWNYFTSGCYPGDVTATTSNKTGFSAVAAGYNWSGFDRFGISAYIWSATQLSDYSAYYRNLGYGNSIVYRGDIDKFTGCSVRCIRDEE